jgi:hypothetical protein
VVANDAVDEQEQHESVEDGTDIGADASPVRFLPEAPASANVMFFTKKGYRVQFTLRGWDEDEVMQRMARLIHQAEDWGWRPNINY